MRPISSGGIVQRGGEKLVGVDGGLITDGIDPILVAAEPQFIHESIRINHRPEVDLFCRECVVTERLGGGVLVEDGFTHEVCDLAGRFDGKPADHHFGSQIDIATVVTVVQFSVNTVAVMVELSVQATEVNRVSWNRFAVELDNRVVLRVERNAWNQLVRSCDKQVSQAATRIRVLRESANLDCEIGS